MDSNLRKLRQLAGKTQKELAVIMRSTQPEISRLEKRSDVRFSTLKKYVEALGCELEIDAVFGDRRVRIRSFDNKGNYGKSTTSRR